ncbi:MAG: Nif3-like dinuclear metal center hexameric protein [Termitinemataceae bacterium]|nr:MAG: Nif3-like dinuclear metal center hexameric protein [Termitinemataceae bacterium]
MTAKDLDHFFRSFLDIEGFSGIDSSMNGLQIDNNGAEIKKIAFAVDASLETFKRAAAGFAGMLFVHHGLYWGSPLPITGAFRERLNCMLSNNTALYAVHLPLDAHPALGNNAVLCNLLGVENREPFGLYHARKIGYKGTLARPLTIEDALSKISFMQRPPSAILPFGKKESATCAVVSGGAAMEAVQAIDENIDLYITGESSHTLYHYALESGLNFIAGGHYNTEVWGVRAVMEHCQKELGIETEFIDLPTGM